jgi:hypothetical protein
LLSYQEVDMEGTAADVSPARPRRARITGSEDAEDASGLSCDEEEMEDESDDEEDQDEEEEGQQEGAGIAGLRSALDKRMAVLFKQRDPETTDREIGVSGSEKERVRKIVAESEEEDYWFAASKDGNREIHYRGLHFSRSLCLLQSSTRRKGETPICE